MRKFTASVAVLLALASLTACGNKEPEPLPPAAEKAKPKHDFFKQDSLKYKAPRKADGTLDDKGKAP